MPNILLIKTSSLGDVVHNLPVVSDIRARFPRARVDWVVEEAYCDIVRMHPAVHRAIPVALRRWRGNPFKGAHWREFGQFRRALAGRRYDCVIDTQGLIKSALLAQAASGTRHGYAGSSAREPLAARLYDVTHAVPRDLHAVVRNRRLAALALGYELPAAFEYGIAVPVDVGSPVARPYCVLLHATSRSDKLWPEAAWERLAAELARQGCASVLPWGDAAERARSERIARALPQAAVPPALDISGMAGLLAGAQAVIGVDTGLTHLAAALGRPVVALYCGSHPGLTGVYAGPGARVRNLGGTGISPEVDEVLAALDEIAAGVPGVIWRLVYRLALWLLFPWVLAHLWWRGRRQPAYRDHIAERFGWYQAMPERPVIWLHAVSVGETRAAEPLLRALAARYAGHQLLLTQMTPTGREAAQQLLGGTATIVYLPYDYPGAVARFLARFQPHLGILMETEIWFNLIEGCTRQGVPLLLANARLSEKSARGYALAAPLTRAALAGLAAVSAQTREDAERLERLGAREVEVTGNLKFDVAPAPKLLAVGARLKQWIGPRPVLLAASTREGEEELVLDAFSRIRVEGLLLLLVPRHPQRFDAVASLLAKRNLSYLRRSDQRELPPDCRVLLGDSMGEMPAYYTACDLAFIGGSLLPYGGQNLIEACAVGRPLLFGRHMYNFAEASRLAIAAGAAIEVADAAMLGERVQALLGDRAALVRMSQAALAFSRAHQGATARNLAICERLLPPA